MAETRESLVACLKELARTDDTPAEPRASLAEAGISLRRASPADAADICPQIAAAFSSEWAEEVAIALERSPPAIHLARDARSGKLAGFVCAGLWARNAFGPMGVLGPFGGRGIGTVLTRLGLRDLALAGETNAVISWVGPEDFYRRIVPVTTKLRFPTFRKAL